jgi:hypothetical protein
MMNWKIHLRLLKFSKKFNTLKFGLWLLELFFLPLLLNIAEFAVCRYSTEKDAIHIVSCNQTHSTAYALMLLSVFLTFIVTALYIIALGIHLHREKVSNKLHEDYLRKKEIEYTVGISEMWNSRYLYAFSSFKSEIFKMFFRVIFNTFIWVLILIHALMVSNL